MQNSRIEAVKEGGEDMSNLKVPGIKRINALKEILKNIRKEKFKQINDNYPESAYIETADEHFNVKPLKDEFNSVLREIKKLEEKADNILRHIRSITHEGEFSCVDYNNCYLDSYSNSSTYGKMVLKFSNARQEAIMLLDENINRLTDKLWTCTTVEQCNEVIELAKSL